jgi:hypothetical protein
MNELHAQSPGNSGMFWAFASLTLGILATGAASVPFLGSLPQVPGTFLLWVVSVVSFLILLPLLSVVGVVFGAKGLQGERGRGLAIAGIVICGLNGLFFVGGLIYVMFFTRFPHVA